MSMHARRFCVRVCRLYNEAGDLHIAAVSARGIAQSQHTPSARTGTCYEMAPRSVPSRPLTTSS